VTVSRGRVCFQAQVKPDRVEEYRERHRRVWPEMLEALRTSGWHNYSLFLRDDGLLIGYFETPSSLAVAQQRMAQTEVNGRWQAEMAEFFDDLAEPSRTRGFSCCRRSFTSRTSSRSTPTQTTQK